MSTTPSIGLGSQATAGHFAERQPAINSAGSSESAVRSAGSAAQSATSARSNSVPSVQESAKVSRDAIQAAATKIQSFVSSMSRDLNIEVDSSSGKAVIQVVDPQSKETVRQIPGEEALRLARTIDYLSSLLVSQKA